MIYQVMKNSALCAKVHAMTGTTLRDADYDELMRMKSVPAVAAYLNENTRYCHVLKDVSISTLHRGRLEQLLQSQVLDDMKALIPYTDTGNKFFMEALELQDGIEKLKVFLRLLHIGHPEQIIGYALEIPASKKVIDVRELSTLASFDEFMTYIKATPYYSALRSFANDPARQKLFYLEVALDTYWAKLIVRYAKKYLSSEDAKLAMKIYGTEIDLNNLAFLLRCKRNFQMTPEEIYACIIPKYYRLTQATVSNIVNSASYDSALDIIAQETPYGNAFHRDDRFLEKRVSNYLCHLNRQIFATHPYSIQAPITYIHLRHAEISNIVSIIEGIRYGLEPEQIAGYLIGYEKGEADA